MSKVLTGLAVAAAMFTATSNSASAYDGYRYRNHISNDYQELRSDGAKVREESEELDTARQHLRDAYRYGSERDVERAEAKVRHERAELNDARRDYAEQREDIERDRFRHYRRHHWWRWWD